ncbi:hypothetical protein [Hyphomonas sp.]|uniref:hypothetical protein n=1 Tax=Hyphomonas sp. TaxID=87 RepID=UPI0039195AD2
MTGTGPHFVLGVSGHRLNQLAAGDLPALSAAIASILGACERGVPGSASWTLVSALAEGTDRIAARAALARSWRLIAPLPFPRSRYIEDFETDASRAEFDALCAAAEDVVIAPDPEGTGDGYTAVGRETVRRADALIAVWKGAPPAGPGGTAHVISDMLAAGGSVVWINPADGLKTGLLLPDPMPAPGTQRRVLADLLRNACPAVPRPLALP